MSAESLTRYLLVDSILEEIDPMTVQVSETNLFRAGR